MGAGGRLGSGRQYQSWISLADEIAAIIHAATTESVSGPLNLTAPEPVTNAEFTRTLAAVLHRPAFFPAPRLALSLVLGSELVDEALLASQRVLPAKLGQCGYEFRQPRLEGALRSILSR
jgi:NAD dependent epimerase/dehydratase family enzyme